MRSRTQAAIISITLFVVFFAHGSGGVVMVGFGGSLPEISTLTDLFTVDPESNGWTDRTGNITHASGEISNSGTVLAALEYTDAVLDSTSQACVFNQLNQSSSLEYVGCLFRIGGTYATSQHIMVNISGAGVVRAYEMTGNTIDENLCDTDTDTNYCMDIGNLDPENCFAITLTGTGTATVVRAWQGTTSTCHFEINSGDPIDPSTWGTCDGGLYGTGGSAPGCTADCNLSTGVGCTHSPTAHFDGTYEDGLGFGIAQHGTLAEAFATRVWFSTP